MERFKTTGATKDFLERLTRATGVRRNHWTRAALGLSLSLDSIPEPNEAFDSDGMEHTRQMIFGDDEAVYLALLRQRHGAVLPDEQLGRIVKSHVERGIQMIQKDYERLNRRGDELMLYLLGQCAATGVDSRGRAVATTPKDAAPPSAQSLDVTLVLGTNARSSEQVAFLLNGPGSAPHIAIMGRNGTGKTRTAMGLLIQLRAAKYSVPFLVFDYAKGDIAANASLVENTGAKVVRLPGQEIELAPLAISERTDDAIRLAAHRFRDTIGSVVKGLGPRQKSRCLDIIRDAYQQARVGTPDLQEVADAAEHLYADNGWPDDSLLACLREFTDFPIFRSAENGSEHEFFQRSHIVDIHGLPEDLRKLTVFLMLDRLYGEIMELPDAPLDTTGKHRQLRLVIVIDEAHHYLACKQPTLEKMVREVRSKGVAIWLLSQSPDDFDQPRYNFSREMGLALVFSCVLEKPKMLEALLGGRVNPQRLSQLPAGVAITRLPGTDSPIEVQAWRV